MLSIRLGFTKPQTPQAACGSLKFPHLAHGTKCAGVNAWCERRLRLAHLDFFLTGTIVVAAAIHAGCRPDRSRAVRGNTPSAKTPSQSNNAGNPIAPSEPCQQAVVAVRTQAKHDMLTAGGLSAGGCSQREGEAPAEPGELCTRGVRRPAQERRPRVSVSDGGLRGRLEDERGMKVRSRV